MIQSVAALCVVAWEFDFFYFVQQWPASYCHAKRRCCYPTTGKPVLDFGIHGLWPYYDDGSYPSTAIVTTPSTSLKCPPPFIHHWSLKLGRSSVYTVRHQILISDLRKRLPREWPSLTCPSGDGSEFWEKECKKHGTFSEKVLNQHSYFQKALDLKSKAKLLQALSKSGIRPNGKYYSLDSVRAAIQRALGVLPYIECHMDPSGNRQLYQVYLCVDSSATHFIKCPLMPHGRCGPRIQFPSPSDSNSTGEDHADEL